jgi:hypothetical protein
LVRGFLFVNLFKKTPVSNPTKDPLFSHSFMYFSETANQLNPKSREKVIPLSFCNHHPS